MKKLLTGIVTAALVVTVITTSVFAASSGRGRNFTDANSDGVCDNAGTSCQYKNGGNVCGSRKGECKDQNRADNFVDENNDGVCDNYTGECKGKNRADNFIDENNDGICDNRADRVRPQDGTGKRNCSRRGCKA